ncbi:MAG TPA: DnaJ domain-containing protein [Candidatus Limnocylindrales bacterium]|nr:DnaJ domain-containing protein [Candidatus Limnocylindrales bacterium]
MTFQGDPHRTLGVPSGASANEIKSAYRRLVKQYHPDTAGERALPRFLAIQAAYERLVDGEGRLRPPGSTRTRGSAPRPPEAWRADAGRARASRDAWRARRAGATGAAGAGSRTSGEAGGGGAGGGPGSSTAGSAGAGGRPGSRPHREHHARRGPRKATPGSTTYDEATEHPFEPEWDGSAWYGPSSGTYWTLNPREYADPRKHGPEYQARARRAAGDPRGGAPGDTPDASPETEAASEAQDWRWRSATPGSAAGPGASTTDGGAEWGTRNWHYSRVEWPDPAPDPLAGTRGRSGARYGDGRAQPPVEDVPFPDLEAFARRFSARNLLALARGPDRRWRLVLALTGWPPVGYAVGSLISQLSGCAAFAPSCPEPMTLVPLLVQPLVIALLVLVPPAAAVTAFAGIVALATALPVAAVLAVGSGPESRVGAPVLGVIVAVAYLVGLMWGIHAAWRAPAGARPDAGGAPPGS